MGGERGIRRGSSSDCWHLIQERIGRTLGDTQPHDEILRILFRGEHETTAIGSPVHRVPAAFSPGNGGPGHSTCLQCKLPPTSVVGVPHCGFSPRRSVVGATVLQSGHHTANSACLWVRTPPWLDSPAHWHSHCICRWLTLRQLGLASVQPTSTETCARRGVHRAIREHRLSAHRLRTGRRSVRGG